MSLPAQYRRVAASLALIAALGAGCSRDQPAETAVAGVAASVTVQPVRQQNIQETLTLQGTVVPAISGDWTIYAPERARIEQLPKGEGAAVKAGDLLVRFEIGEMTQDVAAKHAAVTDAQSRVDSAKAEQTRVAGLVERGLLPRNQLDAANSGVSQAEAALTQVRALAQATQVLADRAVVTARFAGVVAKVWHAEGDIVGVAERDPVLRVVDPTKLQVSMQVPVAQLEKMTAGRAATILVPGTDTGQAGVVASAPIAAGLAGTTGEVRVSFASATTTPVDTVVQVQIVADDRPNALVVPGSCVLQDERGRYVMVANRSDNTAHRRDVTVGVVSGPLIEIRSGLTAGEEVILRGAADLTDGAAISIER